MVEAARARMTVEEFLRWESGDDRRYELINGQIFAMTPPAEAHGSVVVRLASRLEASLRGRAPCRVVGEAGLRIPQRGHDFYVADLAVTCAPHVAGRRHVEEPLLVVEVLSPSTELHDRKIKLPDYRAIPSLQEIAFVDSASVYAEVHRRLDEVRWLTEIIRGREAVLRLATVAIETPLGPLYELLELQEPQAAYRAD
jgi:Uma2 family endonuclease